MEYAEEYSKDEKNKRILLYILLGGIFVLVNQKWLMPYFSWFVETVHCHHPFGYTGISVLWHSLFVALPLFCAFLVGFFSIPLGYKGLVDGQFPPKGTKVLKPTKIYRGWKGKAQSTVQLLLPMFLVLLSIFGYFYIDELPHEVPDDFDFNICVNLQFDNGI